MKTEVLTLKFHIFILLDKYSNYIFFLNVAVLLFQIKVWLQSEKYLILIYFASNEKFRLVEVRIEAFRFTQKVLKSEIFSLCSYINVATCRKISYSIN